MNICCAELKRLDDVMEWDDFGDTSDFNYCPYCGKELQK